MVVEAGRAETLPPHDIDAEEAVIASLLVDSEAIYKVAPRLKSEDFFREKNAWVYDACRALWDRSESLNQITVAHELGLVEADAHRRVVIDDRVANERGVAVEL